MKVTVLGVRPVEYDRKNGGGHVSGFELHYAFEPKPEDDEMNGQYVKSTFTRLDCSEIQPGEFVELGYDYDPKWNQAELVSITPA